uniref:Uncharacterized protein n=1 Tax=Anguilla anguilla TaxID=7936 RepID=A0A0E9SZI5_ANGAN
MPCFCPVCLFHVNDSATTSNVVIAVTCLKSLYVSA